MDTQQQQQQLPSVPNVFADYTQPVAAPVNVFADDYMQSVAAAPINGDLTPSADYYDYYVVAAPASGWEPPQIPWRAVAIAAAVVLIILILYHMCSPRSLSSELDRCGWVVYYRQGCGYCTQQKRVLGGYRRHIECGAQGQIGGHTADPPLSCDSPLITGFPFWYNERTGETRAGLQDASALEKMARR